MWINRLRQEMEVKGWAYTELARRSGVPLHNLKKYSTGKVENPRKDTLKRLADSLGVQYVWFLTGTGPRYTPIERDEESSKLVNEQLLAKIIEVVEIELARSSVRPPPAKYAKLVMFCYHQEIKRASDSLHSPDADTIIRALQLLS